MNTGWLGLALGLLPMLGAACTTVVVETGPGGSGGGGGFFCPDGPQCVDCPSSEPAAGTACTVVDMSCMYPVATDCAQSDDVATCTETGWAITYQNEGCCDDPCACGGQCGEPCPPLLPAQGDACDPSLNTLSCPFDVSTECGMVTVSATCNGATWDVSPPPCVGTGDCTIYTASADCLTDPACRWLFPGCGDPAAPEGCFPAADCAEGTTCASGQSCLKVVTNPCWDSNCTACGMDVFICTGPG